MSSFDPIIQSLITFCEAEHYKGYDPYDMLNSYLPLQCTGHTISLLASQLNKRSPVNFRPLLGIKKDFIHKGMGLFLHAYTLLYTKTKNEEYLNKATFFYRWLIHNSSPDYEEKCWGLNYDYASSDGFFKKFSPSLVVTAFIFNAIFEYYQQIKNNAIKEVLLSAGNFVLNHIPVTQFSHSTCLSYTPYKKDLCFNANALGSQMMAKLFYLTGDITYKNLATQSMNYIIEKQHADGRWNYSVHNGKERAQIDFHQGFILDALKDYCTFVQPADNKFITSYVKGLEFYYEKQFFPNGRSLWRLPKKYPVDIHNQSQGIITFSRAHDVDNKYPDFAAKIAAWTITHMFDKKGFFYYRVYPCYKNTINYMRWSQAWMLLALAHLK